MLKLNGLSYTELQNREMNALRGGTVGCSCSCYGPTVLDSSTAHDESNTPTGHCNCGSECNVNLGEEYASKNLQAGTYDYGISN